MNVAIGKRWHHHRRVYKLPTTLAECQALFNVLKICCITTRQRTKNMPGCSRDEFQENYVKFV